MGAVVAALPTAVTVIRVLGACFLLLYGLSALRRALAPEAMVVERRAAGTGLRAAVGTVLALTWLNPHVYLDTVVLLGALAHQQEGAARWWWAAGAVTGSFVWFFALGFGARLLRPLLARPSAWRVVDLLIAVVMPTLCVRWAVLG